MRILAFTILVVSGCGGGQGKARLPPGGAMNSPPPPTQPLTVPLDPGFQNMPPNSWTLASDVTLEPTAAGYIETGWARITKAALCRGGTAVSQSFTIPTQHSGLAMRIAVKLDCMSLGAPCMGDHFPPLSPGARINGHDYAGGAVTVGGWSDAKTCLGEAAFGPVNLEFRPSDYALSSSFYCQAESMNMFLDHIGLELDASCPPPASVPDGDFESSGNWTVTQPGEMFAIEPGIGTNGSHALHVHTSEVCEQVHVTEMISPPLTSMSHPALSLRYHGSGASPLMVSLGQHPVARLQPTSGTSFQEAKICVPQWAKGIVAPLAFEIQERGGSCITPAPTDFIVDDVQFVQDATCPDPDDVANGDFERADPPGAMTNWVVDDYLGPQAVAGIFHDAANAHSGAGYAGLTISQPCDVIKMAQKVSPLGGGPNSGGPAAKFFYKLAASNGASFTANTKQLAVAASYTQTTTCIGPDGMLSFEGAGPGGLCGNPSSTNTLYIDDVVTTTDPSCPTP